MDRKILPVVVLLVLHAVLLWSSARQKNASVDEMSHLGAGLYSLSTLDFRINRATSPLQNMLCAVPVLLFEDCELTYDNECWRRGIWNGVGSRIYEANPDNFHDLLMTGRMSSIALSVALCGLIFWWAYRCWGYAPALGVLLLAVLEPNVMAHGRLITTDISITLFFLLTAFLAWRFGRKPSWLRLGVLGAGFGLACLSKHSGLLLLPGILLGFGLLHGIEREKRLLFFADRFKKMRPVFHRIFYSIMLTALVFMFGLFVIWAGYAFEVGDSISGPVRPGHCQIWQVSQVPIRTALILTGLDRFYPVDITNENDPYLLLLRNWLPAYSHWEGVCANAIHSKNGHWSYFMGGVSNWGWTSYYPVLFLIKTPIPILIVLMLGAAAFATKRISLDRVSWIHLLAIPAIYGWLMIFNNHANIGYRHFLPVLPFLLILLGGAAFSALWNGFNSLRLKGWNGGKKFIPIAIGMVLLVWTVFEAFSIHPHYLEYYNSLIGGPENGNLYAVDSNLDWGQDLFFLKTYLEEREIDDAWLFYFGPEEYPDAYRIPHQKPNKMKQLEPGTYIISATHLRQFAGILRHLFLTPLKDRQPDDYVTPAIMVYYVGKDIE